MAVSYSRSWNDLLGQPLEPIDEDEARRLHQSGEPYVAYVHDVPGRRDAVVELALFQPSVAVAFLDDRGHRTMEYAFRGHGDGGLFLDELGMWTAGSDGQITSDETHFFSLEDGIITIVVTDAKTGTERSAQQKLGDPGPLFEPIPSFGDYDSITRYDR